MWCRATWSSPTMTASWSVPAKLAADTAQKGQKRNADEAGKREKLGSGVLGLDMYGMREPLAKAGWFTSKIRKTFETGRAHRIEEFLDFELELTALAFRPRENRPNCAAACRQTCLISIMIGLDGRTLWMSMPKNPSYFIRPIPTAASTRRFPSQSRTDVVGARALPRERDRRRARSRQRDRSARGRIRTQVARQLIWWPTDYDTPTICKASKPGGSTRACRTSGPLASSICSAPDWGFNADNSSRLKDLTAIFCANVIHIVALAGGRRFARACRGTAAERRKAFSLRSVQARRGTHRPQQRSLRLRACKSRDPSWGVRDIVEIAPLAIAAASSLAQIETMPANNMTLVFARAH